MLRRLACNLRLILPLWLSAVLVVQAGRPLRSDEVVEEKAVPPKLRRTSPSLLPLENSAEVRARAPAIAKSPATPASPLAADHPSETQNSAPDVDALFNVPPLASGDGEPSVGELISLSAPIANLPQLAPPPVSAASAAPSLPPSPPAAPPKKTSSPTPEQLKLIAVARKVAPSVVALRAWDGFGNQLAEGCGFFIDEKGAVLTDVQLVNPEFADQIEYITVATGTGAFHRITGYWAQDPKTGLTVLQSDALKTPFVLLRPDGNFTSEQPVSIVALSQQNGLSLADATMAADRTVPGDGWLNLRGEDSPGEPGSPVIDGEGRVIAVVSMRVPQGKWFNFGLPTIHILPVLEKMAKGSPQPLSRLARQPHRSAKDDPRFLSAFQTISAGQTVSGVSQLLLLLKSYSRSAEVWALLGLAYSKLGAREEALNCSRKAVALDPEIGIYWQQLALGHLRGEAPAPNPAAREALERTVEEQPMDKIAWLLLAEQQILAGQYEAAEKSLIDVIKLESDYPPASFLLGYVKIQRGELADGEVLLKRCLQLDRQHARAWLLLALLQARQQRLPEAADSYRRLVAVQPRHPHAWRNLALIERKLGHDTAALQAFERHQQIGAPAR